MRQFTLSELAQNDGLDGRPALIAFEGKVYDVSESFLWQKGSHQAAHKTGTDLTGQMADAPHDADLLEEFPVVGEMAPD